MASITQVSYYYYYSSQFILLLARRSDFILIFLIFFKWTRIRFNIRDSYYAEKIE